MHLSQQVNKVTVRMCVMATTMSSKFLINLAMVLFINSGNFVLSNSVNFVFKDARQFMHLLLTVFAYNYWHSFAVFLIHPWNKDVFHRLLKKKSRNTFKSSNTLVTTFEYQYGYYNYCNVYMLYGSNRQIQS